MNPNLKAFLQGFFFCLLLTASSLVIKTYWYKEIIHLNLTYYLGHLVICIICGFAVVFIRKQKRKAK